MKKSFEVNLGGRLFNMNEDAYELLNEYIEQLRNTFSGKEGGDEIINDIEIRLGELCETRMREGCARIVDFEMIDEFITRMGRPESMTEGLSDEETPTNDCDESKTTHSDNHEAWRNAMLLGKRLYRDTSNGIFGGVCSGIAAYTGLNVWLLRVISIITFYIIGLLTAIVYLIAWIALPAATSLIDLLRMRDVKPLPGERLEDAWQREHERATAEIMAGVKRDNKGCLGGCIVAIVALFIIPFILLFSFFDFVVPFIMHDMGLASMPDGYGDDKAIFFGMLSSMWSNILNILLLPAVVIIPLYLIVHYILRKKNKVKPLKHWLKITLVTVWLLMVGALAYTTHTCNIDDISGIGGNIHTHIKYNMTTEKEIEEYLEQINDNSTELKKTLSSYFALADNYTYSKQCKRLLWYHIAASDSATAIPFVCECTQLDDKAVWSIIPRDEWKEYLNNIETASKIEIVGRSTETAELYCVIDTTNKQLWIDKSRSTDMGNIQIETNSIPGWQAEIVKEGYPLELHPECFALSLKIYRMGSLLKGALPKMTLHESKNGAIISSEIRHTLHRTRETK